MTMKGLLFDLDGTLVDTLEDIRAALNHVLGMCYARPIDEAECRAVVGHGLRKALRDALWYSGSAYPQDEFEILYSELVRFYGDHACVHSKVYDGIPSLLSTARDRGLKLGVLSNKADPLVQEIVSTLFPAGTFDFVHGLVEGEKPKPENNAIQGFIGLCNGQEGDVTIIGDSEVDWQTALRAGCRYIVVSYGYRTREELSKSGVDVIADTTGEVEDRLWT